MKNIAHWDTDPLTEFAVFVRDIAFIETSRRRRPEDIEPRPISPQSAEIYTFMFQRFTHWLKDAGLKMSTVDGQGLYAFLNRRREDGERELHSRIAYRYLRLLERCYQHLAVQSNPAQAAIFDADRSATSLGNDKPMAFLTPEQQAEFIEALSDPQTNWKRRRDRAMQLTMLLGGLRVAEAIGLQLSEVGSQQNLDGSIDLELTPIGKHQSSYEHVTVLQAEGADALLEWLAERRQMPFPGQLVFPANFRGDPLNKSTVYRQVRATFTRANLPIERTGGRTLRNTFAVQELDEVSIEELTEHLGLALPRSTELYAHAAKKAQT